MDNDPDSVFDFPDSDDSDYNNDDFPVFESNYCYVCGIILDYHECLNICYYCELLMEDY
jgi:hypothetical protein